jgi:hypothetical protein
MLTNIPGIYAAGDITTYEGKLKLIATGVAEACTAVNHAVHWLDPKRKMNPGVAQARAFECERSGAGRPRRAVGRGDRWRWVSPFEDSGTTDEDGEAGGGTAEGVHRATEGAARWRSD